MGESELGKDKDVVVESSSKKWPLARRMHLKDCNNTVCINEVKKIPGNS